MITIDDFKKVEIKVGEILSAEKVPETDKLIKLQVGFGLKVVQEAPAAAAGAPLPPPRFLTSAATIKIQVGLRTRKPPPEKDFRQVISGIAIHFPDPQVLVGKKCTFVTNLEPRTIRGLESQAMILAVGDSADNFSLFYPDQNILPGAAAR